MYCGSFSDEGSSRDCVTSESTSKANIINTSKKGPDFGGKKNPQKIEFWFCLCIPLYNKVKIPCRVFMIIKGLEARSRGKQEKDKKNMKRTRKKTRKEQKRKKECKEREKRIASRTVWPHKRAVLEFICLK